MRARPLVALALAVVMYPFGPARASTLCSFGGPAGSFAAARLEIPSGSDFLNLRLTGTRPAQRAVGLRAAWHLIQGVALIDASTGALVASRLIDIGSSPDRVVVAAGSIDERSDDVGPDAPFQHSQWDRLSGLPAGTYEVVAFGSDGDDAQPNDWWSAEVEVNGTGGCAALGASGEVFDIDHSQFTGGTQVSAYGAGYADGISAVFHTERHLVFAAADVASEFAGDSSLDYLLPDGRAGHLSHQIVPLVSGAGEYAFNGSFTGPFPLIDVAGVALDLSIG